MSLLSKDSPINVEKSFQKFLYEKLSLSYYINYSSGRDETLEARIKDRVSDPPYWKWIELHWLNVGESIFSVSRVQIDACTLMENDPLEDYVRRMRDDIINELNQDTIELLDFTNDPEHPDPTGNVLIPRFRGARSLPSRAQETTQVIAVDYNLYVFRESILP